MMRRGGHWWQAFLALVPLGWIVSHVPPVSAASPADELLVSVPADMAGCILIEDIAGHYQSLAGSKSYQNASESTIVKSWQASAEYRAMLQAQLLLPIYFGTSLAELRDQIFGDAVVMAFRPGRTPDEEPVGVLMVRARDEKFLTRLVHSVTRPVGDRKVTRLTFRDTEYFRREELGGRVDFVLRMGAIGVLCGQESAVREVIDTHLDKNGLGTVTIFREMRASLPEKCLVQFLLHPRPFDPLIEGAIPPDSRPERELSGLLVDFWHSLRWTAFSLRFTDAMQVGFHLSLDEDTLPGALRPWASVNRRESKMWNMVPADVLAAFVSELDFQASWNFFRTAVPAEESKSVNAGASMFEGFLAGFYDGNEGVLSRLGPEFAVIFAEGNAPFESHLLAVTSVREPKKREPGQLPVATALEHAMQSMMVAYGIEHNRYAKNDWDVKREILGEDRIHYIASKNPSTRWFTPSFALRGDQLILASSPDAIRSWSKVPSEPFSASPFAQKLLKDYPEGYAPRIYVNVRLLREFIVENREQVVAELEPGGDPTRIRQREQRLDLFLSVAGLIDKAVLGSYPTANARHWVLSIYPNEDDPMPEPAAVPIKPQPAKPAPTKTQAETGKPKS